MPASSGQADTTSAHHVLLAYVADLELEVDRLRKQCRCVQQEAREMARRIRPISPAQRGQTTHRIDWARLRRS